MPSNPIRQNKQCLKGYENNKNHNKQDPYQQQHNEDSDKEDAGDRVGRPTRGKRYLSSISE